MPFPNEHAARLIDPSKFKSFRRENDKGGAGVDFIWGVLPDGKVELHTVRFRKDKWTVAQARKWLKEHNMKPIMFEPATEEAQAEAAVMEATATNAIEDGGNTIAALLWSAKPLSVNINKKPQSVITPPAVLKDAAQRLIAEVKAGRVEIGAENSDGHHPGPGVINTVGQVKSVRYNDTDIYMDSGDLFDPKLVEMNKRGLLKKRGVSVVADVTFDKDGKTLKYINFKRVDIVGNPATGVTLLEPSSIPDGLLEAENPKGETMTDEQTEAAVKNEEAKENTEDVAPAQAAAPVENMNAEKPKDDKPDEKIALMEATLAEKTSLLEAANAKLAELEAEKVKAEKTKVIETKIMTACKSGTATPAMKEALLAIGMDDEAKLDKLLATMPQAFNTKEEAQTPDEITVEYGQHREALEMFGVTLEDLKAAEKKKKK